MSFVTFSSRTQSRRCGRGGRMRHVEFAAPETSLSDIATIEGEPFLPPLLGADRMLMHQYLPLEALHYYGPAFRPFHISQKQTLSPSVNRAKLRHIRKYMRKREVPATLVSIERHLFRAVEIMVPHSKDNVVKLIDNGDKICATCSFPATPDDFANQVLPKGIQTLVAEADNLKDVLDASVPPITSLKAPSPLTLGGSGTESSLSLSMSRRRSSCNMPTLQRLLPLNSIPSYTTHDFEGFKIPFPVHPCSTPITPLDQIIHTPSDPPALPHPDFRRGSWSPAISTLSSGPGSAPGSGSTSPQFISPSMHPRRGKLSRPMAADRRRLSVVAPPEAAPMHGPRRLSYSKAYGKHTGSSPLSSRKNSATLGEGLACCPENELLASPLAIRPTSTGPALDACGAAEGIFSKDFSFTFAMSPQATKV